MLQSVIVMHIILCRMVKATMFNQVHVSMCSAMQSGSFLCQKESRVFLLQEEAVRLCFSFQSQGEYYNMACILIHYMFSSIILSKSKKNVFLIKVSCFFLLLEQRR